MSPLVRVEGLRVVAGDRTLLDDIDLDLIEGQRVGVVGESGSGKTLLFRALLGIATAHPGAVAGTLRVGAAPAQAMRGAGRLGADLGTGRAATVFQHPLEGLDPLRTVGEQMVAAARRRDGAPKERRALLEIAEHWLMRMALPDPKAAVESWPHELSGGMAQRVALALALCSGPKLLVADEPTTGLDWARRRDVVDALLQAQEASGATLVVISHDVGVVRGLAERVIVVHGGRIVEESPATTFFGPARPAHPYAEDLLARVEALERGEVPRRALVDATAIGGCAFAPRCSRRITLDADRRSACGSPQPLVTIGEGRRVRCHAAEQR